MKKIGLYTIICLIFFITSNVSAESHDVQAKYEISYNVPVFIDTINNNTIEINVSDNGVGIQDIERALTPFYTSKPNEERSGMGFTVMESFMDKLEVKNNKDGVSVYMFKEILPAVAEM